MKFFVLVLCIFYDGVFSEPELKRSDLDNEGKNSPLIWLILKQLNVLGARMEKLRDIAIENQKNVISLKSNCGNITIEKDDVVNFKVIAVNNKKKIDHLMEKVDLDKSKLEKQINQIKRAISNMGGGDTYVRWGRTTCPSINGTKLVYSGYTGGGYYSHPGRPAEPVCLPTNPNFLKTSGTNSAYIYGTEYETNFFGWNSAHQDVPCSVCHVQFGTTIMIPGKTACNKGWKLQYKGNLAAGHAGHDGASTYLCVDLNQENIRGGSANYNYGYLLYDVVALNVDPCHVLLTIMDTL
ncbi:unnamed protein product [Mytilus coruscus]|uniref:Uncharacterized protein n=1 Tax=Mytilus coruscus TaxID=42192 RepID=A0A6J7ZW30_MYTCO|nr:unnamed protein product [Mytilus coruscus]